MVRALILIFRPASPYLLYRAEVTTGPLPPPVKDSSTSGLTNFSCLYLFIMFLLHLLHLLCLIRIKTISCLVIRLPCSLVNEINHFGQQMKPILVQFYIDFKTINFLMHNVNTARTRLWAFWVDITKCLRINNLITVNSKKSWNSCIFSQARIKKKHSRPPV